METKFIAGVVTALIVMTYLAFATYFFRSKQDAQTVLEPPTPSAIPASDEDAINFSTSTTGAPIRSRPHIVMVIADDLGFHDVGYHGSFIQTPVIDKLASEGVKLESHYVQPLCSPTRSQLLTGRYQIHTGLQHSVFYSEQPIGLPLDSPTLAEQLKKSGYSTNLVGKWHLGYHERAYLPHNRGFDNFFGKLQGRGDHYTHMRPHNGTDYLDLWHNDIPVKNETGHYSTHLYTQKAVEVVQGHNADQPLFLILSYQAPHTPLQVPSRYSDIYRLKAHSKQRRIYAGMVTALDEGIGNLTKALQNKGIWDNTVFIFTSDNGGDVHGGASNYPLRGEKETLWEGGIRGVAFITGGAEIQVARGHVNRNLVHVSDWFPTLLEGVAGSRYTYNDTKPLDGINQWPSIVSNSTHAPRDMILHNIDPLERRHGRRRYSRKTFDPRKRAAIRVGDLKLITGSSGKGRWFAPPENRSLKSIGPREYKNKNVWLFNITADPFEENDLSKTRPDDVRRLLDELHSLDLTSVPAFYPPKDPIKANPARHGDVWGPW